MRCSECMAAEGWRGGRLRRSMAGPGRWGLHGAAAVAGGVGCLSSEHWQWWQWLLQRACACSSRRVAVETAVTLQKARGGAVCLRCSQQFQVVQLHMCGCGCGCCERVEGLVVDSV